MECSRVWGKAGEGSVMVNVIHAGRRGKDQDSTLFARPTYAPPAGARGSNSIRTPYGERADALLHLGRSG